MYGSWLVTSKMRFLFSAAKLSLRSLIVHCAYWENTKYSKEPPSEMYLKATTSHAVSYLSTSHRTLFNFSFVFKTLVANVIRPGTAPIFATPSLEKMLNIFSSHCSKNHLMMV